ncbi:MAG: gamma-glutamylcyclotransferase [Aigarchaeota archaeon]|nr:gamma-glutamylcyclotransferase [Candidatus Pelearchaeum maunauluense]
MRSLLLFVYGLLMCGFSLHGRLKGSRLVGRGFIEGYRLIDLGEYPGAVMGDGRVWGEVYEISESLLEELDRVEDVEGGLYRRVAVDVYFDEEKRFRESAQFYEYTGKQVESARAVEDGDYAGGKGCLNYFAYGSNMASRRLAERNVKPARRIPAILEGYELVFNKRCGSGICANIEPNTGSRVYGALYTITQRELKTLDRYEGYPENYTRRIVRVHGRDGQQYYADVYVATELYKVEGQRPRDDYLSYIVDGLFELGWDEEARRVAEKYGYRL